MSKDYTVDTEGAVPLITPAARNSSYMLANVYKDRSEIIMRNGHEGCYRVVDLWELPRLRLQDSDWRGSHIYPSKLADFNEADIEAFKAEFGVPKHAIRVLTKADSECRKSNEHY